MSTGIIHVTRKGVGFVDTPEGSYRVSRSRVGGAMDGDLVEVERLYSRDLRRRGRKRGAAARTARGDGGGSGAGGTGGTGSARSDRSDRDAGGGARGNRVELRGRVRRVLERAHETVVGILHYLDGLGVVRPCNRRIAHDIFLDPHIPAGPRATEGAVVVVRITTYPGRLEAAAGYIEEVLGQADEVGMDLEVIARTHGFATTFSATVLEEAEQVVRMMQEAQDARVAPVDASPKRRDLRERLIFTIDPEDAEDFDDALSLDFVKGQAVLGVHIADVSACVAWDGALDLSARRRATSVYLPGRVIPMLPPVLSEGLCSLRPHEDRLTFTVEMTLDADAVVVACAFYPSLIRSSARLTYDEAQRLMDEDAPDEDVPAEDVPGEAAPDEDVPGEAAPTEDVPGEAAPAEAAPTEDAPTPPPSAPPPPALRGKLRALRRLSQKLAQRRAARGAIGFEGTEARLVLDGQGVPLAVRLRGKTDATSLVEEAMILANEQVAAFMFSHDAPMVYRIHDEPSAAALEELLPTLREFGYASTAAPLTSREIQAILEASAHRPEHHLISTLLLRAMKQARYTPAHATHFGLASAAYTHFTSPIRRYPDLMVHRLLKYRLAGEEPPKGMAGQLGGICEHSSEAERAAEQAWREATALKLCEYLAHRVGERFSSIITAVNPAGLVVREDTTTAEGFVESASLPDDLIYDPHHHRYCDPATGEGYRLGQPVSVTLVESDPASLRLLFTLD